MENKNIIECIVNNALETQYNYIQNENLSEMREDVRKKYDDNTSKIIELEKIILSMLPKEGQKMYREIESLLLHNLSIESHYMFKKGVIEGLTTFGYLKEISNSSYLPLIKI
jgi:hypothetical protein